MRERIFDDGTSLNRALQINYDPSARNWDHYSEQPGHQLRGLENRSHNIFGMSSVQRWRAGRRMRIIPVDGKR